MVLTEDNLTFSNALHRGSFDNIENRDILVTNSKFKILDLDFIGWFLECQVYSLVSIAVSIAGIW